MTITLKNLSEATAQEVFDQAAAHLLTQMKRAKDHSHEFCSYITKSGLKCAGGCFISSEDIKELEERDLMQAQWYMLVQQGIAPDVHLDLIEWLQGIHDSKEPQEWREALIELANRYNLQFNYE